MAKYQFKFKNKQIKLSNKHDNITFSYKDVNKDNTETKKKETETTEYIEKNLKSTFRRSKRQALKLSSNIKELIQLKKPEKNVFQILLATFKGVKITTSSALNLLSGIFFIVVMVLYIGVFSSLSDNNVYGLPMATLSKEVIAYSGTINEYANMYNISEFTQLIKAIMMQESKGLGDDPMGVNASNPTESIKQGTYILSQCLTKSICTTMSDKEKLYLAIQGYNYGLDYIEWANTNFGTYSKSNAKVYYDIKQAETNNNFKKDPNYVNHVLQYLGINDPNFNNHLAWGDNNPYSAAKLYGQCTWFAWGRFYEIYGYSPGFLGNGDMCAMQLVEFHPSLFELSAEPKVGAIFSCIGRNHVGIVIHWDGTIITIQEGNMDGITNKFQDATKDWRTATYTLEEFREVCKGVIFAVPIN